MAGAGTDGVIADGPDRRPVVLIDVGPNWFGTRAMPVEELSTIVDEVIVVAPEIATVVLDSEEFVGVVPVAATPDPTGSDRLVIWLPAMVTRSKVEESADTSTAEPCAEFDEIDVSEMATDPGS